ncbi:tyrosine-type recombinase/integrase [Bacillus velezensis]|uniref:hypothetical protein n=1 Tax=Bacillus velezensis TaxID=492670 RepID=UPI0007D0689E|nr:hypothetical protein [Bacillus velezensis]OAL91713.1 hypothetical protein AY610_04380 [Bacillus velezensis]
MAVAEKEKRMDHQPYYFKNYLQDWLKEHKLGSVRKNTFELHKRNISNHIIPYFKDIDIRHKINPLPKIYQPPLRTKYSK